MRLTGWTKAAISAVALAAVLTATASAVTVEECRQTQETAHRMAECARMLGYPEDHLIIQEAQEKWWDAYNREQAISAQKCDLVTEQAFVWDGPVLTKQKGVNWGPTGKETYYNLNMSGVVRIMRGMGFDAVNYPYWVRSDGCKMLGGYILCAANLNVFPRGTLVESSLGTCIVADTGGFARNNPYQLDIATNW